MKNITIFSVIIIFFTFLSCHQEPKIVVDAQTIVYEPGDTTLGFCTFKKNELNATASGNAYKHKNIDSVSIGFYAYSKSGTLREIYELGFLPKKVGKIKLLNQITLKYISAGSMSSVHGDVLVNTYNLDENKDNYAEITYIDSKIVKGKFQLYLNIKKPDDPNEPDNVIISEATFVAKFKN